MKMLVVCGALLSLLVPAHFRASAQTRTGQQAEGDAYNANTWSQADAQRIVQDVRHKLLSLTDYSVFDSLSFGIQGRSIILHGYASRPILKDEAERTIKSIEGVSEVQNQIKVLPNSPNDDRIRIGVYRRIYGQPALRKYTGSPVEFGDLPSIARMAGGITQDPPRGYHAIHIIVDNGHVTLTGVVDNEGDANIASMQANSTPGTFSVDNELLFPGASKKEQ
jgi:hyperosmotically inducible protein